MSILNVGARALMANQTLLQTTGNNIANVNTPGYSRQSAVLQTVQGQFTGSGYIGKGVDISTIQRNYSEFLTRQSTLASATDSADNIRAGKLQLLGGIFEGGSNGLGAAINDMMNAFSDVASAPTDLTARTVALTRVSETASRMRASSQRLDDLQLGVAQELKEKVSAINTLAQKIANVNDQIANAQGKGQPPNDLLDQRDQLIRDLNQFIQTTSIPATDGSVGIFIGGSQALVLGNTVSPVVLVGDDYKDPLKNKLAIIRNKQPVVLDDDALAGGEVPGLLRFQNTDMAEGRNLLGRLTLAVSTKMNEQQSLGLDLDGNIGTNLFTPTKFTTSILQPSAPAQTNLAVGASNFSLSVDDVSLLAASDYELTFSGATNGVITRLADGVVIPFDFAANGLNTITVDGLSISSDGTAAAVNDRILIKPFSTSASNIRAEFSSPRALAVASPVAGKMGTINTGSLQLASLQARTNPPAVETTATSVVLTFTDANHYTRSDEGDVTSYLYTSGQAIEANFPVDPTVSPYTYTLPLAEWSVTLQGSPKAGDTFTVFGIKDSNNNNGVNLTLNADNAVAMMNLRDLAMFDGAAMTDGYAGMISQLGIRAQSANYSAEVSSSIAANLERDRTGISGVNLDEEAAKLLQYQQAYQASAKMVQVAQGIFDTLMQSFR